MTTSSVVRGHDADTARPRASLGVSEPLQAPSGGYAETHENVAS